jgi:hypothetical protein
MSDRNRELNQASLDLADGLRALPLQAPQRSAWPELSAQLRKTGIAKQEMRSERLRRFVVPAVLAASLAAVFVIAKKSPAPALPTPIATVAPVGASSSTNSAKASNIHNAATDAAQLAKLQQRSQDLERWLRDTGAAAMPLQGQDLVAATEIENLIGLVDVELAAPQETRDAGLWQRRVALLEDLSALRYSNYELAAGGGRVLAASLTN